MGTLDSELPPSKENNSKTKNTNRMSTMTHGKRKQPSFRGRSWLPWYQRHPQFGSSWYLGWCCACHVGSRCDGPSHRGGVRLLKASLLKSPVLLLDSRGDGNVVNDTSWRERLRWADLASSCRSPCTLRSH